MAGHLLRLASGTPPEESASSSRTWWVVEGAWSKARLRPPAHCGEVDAEGAQRVGIRDKPAYHLAEGRPAGVQRDAELGQGAHPRRIGLGEDAEQEVLRAEPGVPEGASLLFGADDDLAGRGRESLEHCHRRPCFLCTACLLTPTACPISSQDQPCRLALSTWSASRRSTSCRSAATACRPTRGSGLVEANAASTASVILSTYIDRTSGVNLS